MVNVAGRSKGCTNCRRRRVKCDEHRPTCLRCQKSRLDCDGPRDLIILEDRISSKPSAGRARIISHHSNSESAPLVPAPLVPATNDYELSLCFANRYIKHGGPIELAQREIRPTDIDTLQIEPSSIALFKTAYLSLALLWTGQQTHQPSIFDKGLAVHSLTLRKLYGALLDPVACISDEVLLTIATLALLEVRIPTSNSSYLKHIMGLQQLLQLRDPAIHRSNAACLFYLHTRHMITFASVKLRVGTIFARPDWKALLRSYCSAEELWEQELFDILADCSCLYARCRDHATAVPVDRIGLAKVVEEAHELLHQLRLWRSRWDQEARYTRRDDSDTLAGLKAAVQVSQTAFTMQYPIKAIDFKDGAASALLLQYNACIISVSRLLLLLQVPAESNTPDPSTPAACRMSQLYAHRSLDEYGPRELNAALEICCCVPYIVSRNAHKFCRDSPAIHWSITTAWMMLGQETTPVGKWITDTLGMKDGGQIAKGLWESEKGS